MAITDNDLKKLKTVFATKDDLKNLELKIDGKFADLDNTFATKDDLKNEIRRVERLIDEKNDDLKDEISEQFLSWRDDFYSKIDPVLKEISKNDEERTIMNHKINKNTKRIDKVEKRLAIT